MDAASTRLIETIRADPAWNNGNYSEQPPSFRRAVLSFNLATSGGTKRLHHIAPTREQADKVVEARLAQRFVADANNYIYSYDAARDYDPSPNLEKIKAHVLAINSGDDERNPAELGILDREIKRVKNGRYYLVPASADREGHRKRCHTYRHTVQAVVTGGSVSYRERAYGCAQIKSRYQTARGFRKGIYTSFSTSNAGGLGVNSAATSATP